MVEKAQKNILIFSPQRHREHRENIRNYYRFNKFQMQRKKFKAGINK
jgi:hypothetical protein